MANWALGPLALGPISVPDSKRSTAYLCLCILPMRRSLFNGQLGPGALGPGPMAQYPSPTLNALLPISVYVSSQVAVNAYLSAYLSWSFREGLYQVPCDCF